MTNETDRQLKLEGRLSALEVNISSIKGSLERIEVGLGKLVDRQGEIEVKVAKNTTSNVILKWVIGSGVVGTGTLAAMLRFIS